MKVRPWEMAMTAGAMSALFLASCITGGRGPDAVQEGQPMHFLPAFSTGERLISLTYLAGDEVRELHVEVTLGMEGDYVVYTPEKVRVGRDPELEWRPPKDEEELAEIVGILKQAAVATSFDAYAEAREYMLANFREFASREWCRASDEHASIIREFWGRYDQHVFRTIGYGDPDRVREVAAELVELLTQEGPPPRWKVTTGGLFDEAVGQGTSGTVTNAADGLQRPDYGGAGSERSHRQPQN